MYVSAGACPKCGAPIYTPADWNAVVPPPITYMCQCRFAVCEHHFCRQELTVADDSKPHRVCCKCNKREPLGYSLKIDYTETK